MTQHQGTPLLTQFRKVFLLCKFFGIYPYDLRAFQREYALKKSKYGAWLVIGALVVISIFYNLLIYSLAEEDRSLKESQSTLTFVIGLFLTYIGLVMMATDQLTAIKNQSNIGKLYERIRAVDERLCKENIVVDNNGLAVRISTLIAICICCEVSIMVSTYLVLVDYSRWTSALWVFSCLPTLYNSLDKFWFANTLFALKQRFAAINLSLEDMVEAHEKFMAMVAGVSSNSKYADAGSNIFKKANAKSNEGLKNRQFEHELGFLYTEISPLDMNSLMGSARSRIAPIAHSMNSFGEDVDATLKQGQHPIGMINMAYESELNNIAKTEEKLNNICQLHDEICEIAKTLNELWSYSILVLMGYGFLIFTAQLYFLYCATQKQAIPSLFRSAKNAAITAIYLSYTAGKCIYLVYLSWKTSLECKRTGICMHKCSVVADNNSLYEIVNHLSLKLLNHSVDFSACGFFSLDMDTLFGMSGAITSYLIILIQFNLAAQQAKEAVRLYSTFNDTANLVAVANENNGTTLWNAFSSTVLGTTATVEN